MKFRNTSLISLCLLTLGQVFAIAQTSVPADQTVTVNAMGPVTGPSGDKYFNVEGKAKGKYACFGLIKFNTASLKEGLDKKFGPGKYQISTIILEMNQSNAKFTAGGGIKVYYSADAKVDPAKLKYPFDAKSNSLAASSIAAISFTPAAMPTLSAVTINKDNKSAKKPPRPETHRDAIDLSKGAGSKLLNSTVLSGGIITLILAEGDNNVAATWSGKSPVGLNKPPRLSVVAGPKR